MAEKYVQTIEELEHHLQDQVMSLKRSSEGFDTGDEFEAPRIASAIRLLVHDTKNSNSLLTQLSKKNIEFYETSTDAYSDNPLTFNGILGILITPEGPKYLAPLDDVPPPGPTWAQFDDWWNRVIFVDKSKQTMTRRDLVLSVADQDGGAHVDAKLNPTYADLSRRNSIGWTSTDFQGTQIEMGGPEKAALRQLAHEVLKSLDPEMPTRKLDLPDNGALFMGAKMTSGETQRAHPQVPKAGRNELCPCGSGKKYKKCALRQSLG